MSATPTTFKITSADVMAEFAQRVAKTLRPGDCVLLEGPIGAGKSHFARSAILSLLDQPEDVPSPTFTLVQTYTASVGDIWHADLYRLIDPNDVFELGLDDAFEDAICFVEWPDRLGSLQPKTALCLSIAYADEPDTRMVTLTGENAVELSNLVTPYV